MTERKLATHRKSSNANAGYWIGDEEVNGIVIGPMTDRYEFWHKVEYGYGVVFDERITRGEFENDADAVAWFKANYPEHFAKGVEMRVYA